MVFKPIIHVLVTLAVSLLFNAFAFAGNCAPFVDKTIIGNMNVLADNIEASLQSDPSGDGDIEGAYITPNHIMSAIQKAEGPVDTVNYVPTYLRSLKRCKMPDMAKWARACLNEDTGKHEPDFVEGVLRGSRHDEFAWCDVSEGKVIFAGDCTNSLISLNEQEPKVAHKRLSKPLMNPLAGSCPGGDPDRAYVALMVYHIDTIVQECAIDRTFPSSIGPGNLNALSNKCAKKLLHLENSGLVSFSSQKIQTFADIVQINPVGEVDLVNMSSEEISLLLGDLSLKGLQITHDGIIFEEINRWSLFEGWVHGDTMIPKSAIDKELIAGGKHIFIPDEYFNLYDDEGYYVRELNNEELSELYIAFHFSEPDSTFSKYGIYQSLDGIRRVGCSRALFAAIETPPHPELAENVE